MEELQSNYRDQLKTGSVSIVQLLKEVILVLVFAYIVVVVGAVISVVVV